ncbi:MAG: M23 family metallopeptidase [Candidatus Cloacimonetes bacterium]|nr:M23 family metallopeptidase [Candidatus Cloacimonadota bacterium]
MILSSSAVRILIFCLLLFPCQNALFAGGLLQVRGIPRQGSLMVGEVSEEVESVFLDYKPIAISQNKFYLGFDRDEPLEHRLTIVLQNGKILTSIIELTCADYEIEQITLQEERFSTSVQDPETSRRIEMERQTMQESKKNALLLEERFTDFFIRPVPQQTITGSFGAQRIVNGVPSAPHNGIDIAAPRGTPVKTMADGIVMLCGEYFYQGNFVIIYHGHGLTSSYYHLDRCNVEVGMRVEVGEMIGEVGSSGRSTGAHLHWGIEWCGRRINPESLLELSQLFLVVRE